MEANELRIGNYVNLFKGVNDEGADYKIYQISSGFDLYKLDENDCDDIEPIELSEEWFLKFGFEKHEKNPFWFRKGNLMVGLIGVAEMMNELGSTVRISTWINNVHQLQNLYFALTGSELELKNEEK